MNPAPTFSRRVSPLTIELARNMATDPASPQGLREFHQTQLVDLQRRQALQTHVFRTSNPFSRFADSLGEPGNPETV